MKKRLKKTVLITGASGGLGLAFAKIFARKGYHLILVARNESKLLTLKKELEAAYHIQAELFAKDLSQKDAADDIFHFTAEKGLFVDVLINNAGFGDFGEFTDCSWQKQYEMVQVNIVALMQLSHCFLPGMKERGHGKILNVASIAAFQPGPLMSVYYATKAYVLSFTEALSVELQGTGVTVTALCPGPIQTDFEERANLKSSGLFHHMKVSSAKEVAEYGYLQLMKGKVVAIHSWQNRLTVLASRLAPPGIVRKCVYLIQKQI